MIDFESLSHAATAAVAAATVSPGI